jgi:hypothetical protein
MLKFLRRFRKKFKTACLAAVLATCWGVGQTAQAAWTWDKVTLKFSGTVSPSTQSMSHLFFIYGTNYSYHMPLGAINLGDFTAGQSKQFSVIVEPTIYNEGIFWAFAGLYGNISGGQYAEGVNGVTLGVIATAGDSWDSHADFLTEGQMFSYIFNSDQQNLLNGTESIYTWNDADISSGQASGTVNLFDFSNASANGQIQINAEIVPEPVSIILFGGGGLIMVAIRRRKQ